MRKLAKLVCLIAALAVMGNIEQGTASKAAPSVAKITLNSTIRKATGGYRFTLTISYNKSFTGQMITTFGAKDENFKSVSANKIAANTNFKLTHDHFGNPWVEVTKLDPKNKLVVSVLFPNRKLCAIAEAWISSSPTATVVQGGRVCNYPQQ